ncbi:hypothetical protein AAAC51_34725 [Priestia megaterium]
MKKFGIILASLALFFSLSTGVTAQAASQNLSTTNAVKIAANASNHFWNALHGSKGNLCTQKHLIIKALSTHIFVKILIQKAN